MPVFTASKLRCISETILGAAGAPPSVAQYMARSLVESNLMGHDSHGVIRIPYYVQIARNGTLDPAAEPCIIKETPVMALVDGKWAFGQVATRFGTEVAIKKAKESGLAAVGVVRCHHNGRIGEYVTMAAEAGMVGMVLDGGTTRDVAVAPHGGSGRALATNPFAVAIPAGERPPVLVDYATSVVAEGKLQVARAKGVAVAPGLIIDKNGLPTTNVEDFYAGGAILPSGGHKGYGLAIMAELLAGLLTSAEIYGGENRTFATFILAIDVAPFRPPAEFGTAVDERLRKIKAVPPAPGFDEVLIPGEPEYRTRAEREQTGITVPENTWQQLLETARELGVEIGQEAGAR